MTEFDKIMTSIFKYIREEHQKLNFDIIKQLVHLKRF